MPATNSEDASPSSPRVVQERGSLRTLEKGQSQFIGSSSGIYFVKTVQRAFSDTNRRQPSFLLNNMHPNLDDCIVSDNEEERQERETSRRENTLLSPPLTYGPGIPIGLGQPPELGTARHLFMSYFQTWHRFFPFLHGPTLLKDMEDLYVSQQRPTGPIDTISTQPPQEPTTPLTLAQVIIFQCIFNLAGIHSSIVLPPESRIKEPTEVVSFLPRLATRGDLVSIQAMFATQLLLIARMSLRNASVVGGLVSRSIFLAGLHRCPSRYQELSSDECDIRKRLFWSIYVADRYLSQALGHPLGIQDSDIDVCSPAGSEIHSTRLEPASLQIAADDHESHAASTILNSNSDISGSPARSIHPRQPPQTPSQNNARLVQSSLENISEETDRRHLILACQSQYSRLLGRAVELFHKSIHARCIDAGSILELRTDINAWWNSLPISLQEYAPSETNTSELQQHLKFNEAAHFNLLHSQLVLLINRPWLSLEPSTPEFRSALQVCISESRDIINIMNKQHNAGFALFWPCYLSTTWMAGIILAFACHLQLYREDKGKREISLCLQVLLAMSQTWKLASKCHVVLSELYAAILEKGRSTNNPAADISVSATNNVFGASGQQDIARDSAGPLSADQDTRKRKRARVNGPNLNSALDDNSGLRPGTDLDYSDSGQFPNNTSIGGLNDTFDFSRGHGTSDPIGTTYSGVMDNPQGVRDSNETGYWDSRLSDILGNITWESLLQTMDQDSLGWDDMSFQ